MLKAFRLRIAIWFVVLSSIIYVALTALGVAGFVTGTSQTIDEQLRVLASEFGHAVAIEGDKPSFRDWARAVKTDPSRGLASIQLFDGAGNLMEEFGPRLGTRLLKYSGEYKQDGVSYRCLYTPLTLGPKTVGYLQFELPTTSRDQSIERLLFIACLIAPCVLVGLGATSYFVAGLAAKPLSDNLDNMRRFIADAGHELNTPLTIARAKIESFEKSPATPGDIESLMRSIKRMEIIVEDLMYIAELDTREKLELANVDLADIAAQIYDDFEVRFQDKGIHFNLEKAANQKLMVTGERELLYRALSNLTENALRYTPSGGTVSLKLAMKEGNVLIRVTDNGIGVPPESREKIFERFYRVDKSRSRESGGVGLGLSIVKSIVEKHKGTVTLEALEPGSCFTVSLKSADTLS